MLIGEDHDVDALKRLDAVILALLFSACGGSSSERAPATPAERHDVRPRGSWRPFSAASPWNRPIGPEVSIHPESSALAAHLAASAPEEGFYLNIAEYSIPVYWVSQGTPRVRISATLSNAGEHTNLLVPWTASMRPAAGTDLSLAIIDRAAGEGWDFWAFEAPHAKVAASVDYGGTGVRPLGPRRGPRDSAAAWWRSHGARACGYPLVAGLAFPEEFEAGVIEHALALGYPGIRPGVYVPPASTAQADFERIDPARGIPCGGRIRLDPQLDLDAEGLTGHAATLARALQRYGAFIADFSGVDAHSV